MGSLRRRLFLHGMISKPFRFKQFAVADEHCTHKVGTDGVLLGSWVNIREEDDLLLDIGTGSGLIALMLAQRSHSEVRIDAIEIDEEAALQATRNIQDSPWPEKVQVRQTAVQDFLPAKEYALIVSNPPYFIDSLLPPDQKRTLARHAERLSFDELLQAVDRLLSADGRFAVILPFVEGRQFIQHAGALDLFPVRISSFRSRRHKPVERLLVEFRRSKGPLEETEIVLYSDGENWSEEYKELTAAFYLRA